MAGHNNKNFLDKLQRYKILSAVSLPFKHDNYMESKDPLHGMTLEKILIRLVDSFGWDELGYQVRINCFISNPSIQSSLKFLRKTPWARTKVEEFYKDALKKGQLK
ncbi:Uncharacterized conserved protein [Chitinophaga sancti]|uniref:Uncharacterized conserved protein n=2 Tax=Chitinophaga sancti TaxID=1004 RepID=A0A1K1SYM2_9BACT|nr:Uncharacterized conserved protein [Chitinophaga sancti]